MRPPNPKSPQRAPHVPEPGESQGTWGSERSEKEQEEKPIEASRPDADQPRRRRSLSAQIEYLTFPGFPPIRKRTLTELREGLDEDMERACWASQPFDHDDMMSFADRLATLGELEKEEGGQ